MIKVLKPNQVFVFGSNAGGFHGAGAASYAFCGRSNNDWRTARDKQDAIKAPVGSSARVGKWAVWGMEAGLQEGREGKSWAIITKTFTGVFKYPPELIANQVRELCEYAKEHPEMEFLVTKIGEGYAGIGKRVMDECVWNNIVLPPNVRRV
jgi:hypothetical protein